MIEKSRLEELIEQGATIYTLFIYGVKPYKLNKSFYIAEADGEESLMTTFFDDNGNIQPELIDYLQDIYETKEKAEWVLKYQRIPRTEYLDLPTWEEFKKNKQFIFISVVILGMRLVFLGEKFAGNFVLRMNIG